jgi:hypothetical protein
MQAQGQFTPEQLIVAGRRAEAQGQPAYALQFYRYIADHFASSTEAYEARDAIFRLNQPAPEAADYAGQPAANTYAQPQIAPAPTLEIGAAPTRPTGGRKSEKRSKRRADVEDTQPEASGPSYRIGRFVAAVIGTIGWLLFLVGLVMGPLMIVALTVKAIPKGIRDTIAGNLMVAGGMTFGTLFLGLFAIFAAQAARATFDTAEAVRYLLQSAPNRDSADER